MTPTARKRLFLIDGTALAYRSHFAFSRNNLTTSDGRPAGAIFGFANTLRALIEKEKPDLLIATFDSGGETFRHRIHPEYKATREKPEDAFLQQLPVIEEVAAGYGAFVLKEYGVEADDIIGTMTVRGRRAGMDVVIVSMDKDLAQLVDEHTVLYILPKFGNESQTLDPEGVLAKFGVPPAQMIDYLSLVGDTSDNIPGAKGVGPVNAAKLLKEFGTSGGVVNAARSGRMKASAMRDNIIASAAQVERARVLVSLDTNLPRMPEISDVPEPVIQAAPLRALFRKLEFNQLLNSLPAAAVERPVENRNYKLVDTPEKFEALLSALGGATAFALDTETTGLDAIGCEIVGISFSTKPLEAWYMPLKVDPPVLHGGRAEALSRLKPLIENPGIQKIGQNAKYDALVLGELGIRVAPISFDTMVASFCVAPHERAHNLDALALRYLNVTKIPTEELIGSGRVQTTMDTVPVEKVCEYACEDADVTFRLKALLEKELAGAGTTELFHSIEMPLVPVLVDMERRGVKIDAAMLQKLSKVMAAEQLRLEGEIYDLAGGPFKVNSPKELGIILFERMRLHEAIGRKNARKTKTGYSTDAEVLEELAAVAPIAQKVLEYRQVTKLQNTYLETLPTLIHPKTGRVHTTFRQAVAATGRLSSDNPNLQNIPIRTAMGREIRRAFVPEPGNILISADYSQIELRLVAHFSQDKVLKGAFDRGEDIHRRTASVVFGVAPEFVTIELRSRAKAINFGIIYGMGPQRLARETGMTVPEAKKFIDAYFERLPGVRQFLDDTLREADAHGYAKTLAGRRRAIPELKSDEPRVRANAENIAVNTPIQGSAADIIKMAMIALDRRLAAEGIGGGMILQVHDELVLEVPERDRERASIATRECMENACSLSVPLKVDLGIGTSWIEAHA